MIIYKLMRMRSELTPLVHECLVSGVHFTNWSLHTAQYSCVQTANCKSPGRHVVVDCSYLPTVIVVDGVFYQLPNADAM